MEHRNVPLVQAATKPDAVRRGGLRVDVRHGRMRFEWRDGDDHRGVGPVARLGYMDYSESGEVFEMMRPQPPR